jgi:hypothetical protein
VANNLTDFGEDAFLGVFRGTSITGFTAYLALFTTDPTEVAGGGTEVSGGSYARIPITCNAQENAASGTGRRIRNTSQLQFAVATANWGTITHAAICDASTGGNRWAAGPLTASQAINTGQRFVIDPQQLEVAID